MKITMIGTGYVGLVTGACLAETGNEVTCLDIDEGKIQKLKKSQLPFYEPGLTELVARNISDGRLHFSSNYREALSQAKMVFVCVGTPSTEDGAADLKYVFNVVDQIAEVVSGELIVVIKSTVPIGTSDQVRSHLESRGKRNIHVVSNPEFLREGTAVQDCMQPDRIVIGTEDVAAGNVLRELYSSFVRTGKPIYLMNSRSAEMSKYASNALLAARISFINEIAMLCERMGADVRMVRQAVGADSRIGPQYLFPSVGFGGSCFPKDVRALAYLAEKHGMEPGLFRATLAINETQKKEFVKKVKSAFDKPKGTWIAIWGLSFKAKTDDIRESPALTVIDGLLEAGFSLTVYDPVAIPNAKALYGNKIQYGKSEYSTLEGASALCVLTEWNPFRHPDFAVIKQLLKTPIIFDGRNLYDPDALAKLGFTYYSIGRPDRL